MNWLTSSLCTSFPNKTNKVKDGFGQTVFVSKVQLVVSQSLAKIHKEYDEK